MKSGEGLTEPDRLTDSSENTHRNGHKHPGRCALRGSSREAEDPELRRSGCGGLCIP